MGFLNIFYKLLELDETFCLEHHEEIILPEYMGRDPLIGLNFMIWKSQEFLQAPNMID
jgi:hypothetical protein